MGFVSSYTRGKSRPALHQPDDKFPLPSLFCGLEFEVESPKVTKDFKFFTAKSDGSLRNGIEYVTSAPLCGKQLSLAISEFFEKNDWYKISPRCGLHVHIDMTQEEDTPDVVVSLLLLYYVFEDLFFQFAGDFRRTVGFSYPIEESFNYLKGVVNDYFREASGEFSQESLFSDMVALNRYFALNVNSLYRHGTYEFRHLEMTGEEERCRQWLDIIMCLKKFALSTRVVDIPAVLTSRSINELVNIVFYSPRIAGVFKITPQITDSISDKIQHVTSIIESGMENSGRTLPPASMQKNPIFAKKYLTEKKKKRSTRAKKVKAPADAWPGATAAGAELETISLPSEDSINPLRSDGRRLFSTIFRSRIDSLHRTQSQENISMYKRSFTSLPRDVAIEDEPRFNDLILFVLSKSRTVLNPPEYRNFVTTLYTMRDTLPEINFRCAMIAMVSVLYTEDELVDAGLPIYSHFPINRTVPNQVSEW